MVAGLMVVAAVDLALLLRRAMMDVVSPYDEGYHLSHVEYAYNWSMPRLGDPMLRWSEEAYACFPTYPYGQVTAVPCGVDGESTLYPEAGTNTAASWPPVYYLFAAQVSRLVLAVTSLDPLHAARISSVVLWTLGCVLVAYLAMRVSGSPLLGVASGVLGAAWPAAWAIGSYVTPHSAVMVIGAGLVAASLWVAGHDTRPHWALAVALAMGVLIGLTLPHALVAVAAACIGLLFSAFHRRPWSRRIVAFSAVLGLSNSATYVAWSRAASAWAVGPTAPQPTNPPEGLLAALQDNWDLFLPRQLAEVAFLSPVQTQAAKASSYLVLALLGAWLLQRTLPIPRAVAFGLVLAAPLFPVIAALELDFPVPPRYGASILGMALFLVAFTRSPVWFRIFLLVLAGALAVVAWRSTGSYLYLAPGTSAV